MNYYYCIKILTILHGNNFPLETKFSSCIDPMAVCICLYEGKPDFSLCTCYAVKHTQNLSSLYFTPLVVYVRPLFMHARCLCTPVFILPLSRIWVVCTEKPV